MSNEYKGVPVVLGYRHTFAEIALQVLLHEGGHLTLGHTTFCSNAQVQFDFKVEEGDLSLNGGNVAGDAVMEEGELGLGCCLAIDMLKHKVFEERRRSFGSGG